MTIEIREIDSGSVKVALQHRPKNSAREYLTRARAAAEGIGYAGNVTPQQAWALFSSGIAELVDVRTSGELQRTGAVPCARHVEWLQGESMQPNPHFLSELKRLVGKENVVLLLCRSGRRSIAAAKAATQAGFHHVFNVLEGVEGDGAALRGWLRHGLPVTTE